jgi:transposase
MTVTWKGPSDPQCLKELVATTADARQRDRYRVVLLAGEGSALAGGGWASSGQLTREQIAQIVGRSRQFVDQWVGRYRGNGLPGLIPHRPKGRPSKLTPAEQQELCHMLDSGPPAEEGIAAYNGPILRERIETRFKKIYTLDAVYKLLHRLGYNDLMPRPHHPDTDPAALEAFKKRVAPEAGGGQVRSSRQAGAELLPG